MSMFTCTLVCQFESYLGCDVYMVIHITEYIILTVSRYLIICEPLDLHCSPSQSLCSVLTRNDQNPGKGVYMPIHPIFYLRTTGSTAYAGFSMRILVCMELHSIGNASQSMFIQRKELFFTYFIYILSVSP